MTDREESSVRAFWNDVAEGWRVQVGRDGDVNRRLVSDPVLWALLGSVEGKRILDAGCGTGYLSRQLRDRGAHVTGVDLSDEMIAIARSDHPDIDFRRESVSRLESLEDATCDAVVANYVLMDVPDLEGTVRAFHRVLRIARERYPAAEAEGELRKLKSRPYSVAFRLRKPTGA